MCVYFNFRMQEAILVLEDGTVFKGRGFFVDGEIFGEVVFNTSMTGYEEAFTDPSYSGQILVMTYPLIGNYGFHERNSESSAVQIRGLVVREPCLHQARGTRFVEYLRNNNLACIYGIDTRSLTLRIRDRGTMKGMICRAESDARQMHRKIEQASYPDAENLVAGVSCKRVMNLPGRKSKKVVLIDCGVKESIIRCLRRYASVIQVPYDTDARLIDRLRPDAVVISNGPGNPAHPDILGSTVKTVRNIVERYPVLGICLGHQILGIALGLRTYKMKFGHRGSNHGVKELSSNRVYITSQNHGYAIEESSAGDVTVSWLNVNDRTIEGIRHRRLPVYGIQFHPEAGPGPWDTRFIFKELLDA